GGEGDAPVGEGLEGAVVRGDHGGRRDLHGLGAVVVLDLDDRARACRSVLRRAGRVRAAAAGGEGEAEGTSRGEGAEAAPGEGGHEGKAFSRRRGGPERPPMT